MNQHEFVVKCQKQYAQEGLIPGNPDDGDWEEAHYPAPFGKGDTVIFLLSNHHQIQGLLQSEEYGGWYFYQGAVSRFLTHGPFVENWFELWDLYDKWTKENGKEQMKKLRENHPDILKSNTEKMNAHPNTAKVRVENGRRMGRVNVKAMHAHPNTRAAAVETGRRYGAQNARMAHERHPNMAKENGRKTSSQRWQCLETGYISTPGGLAAYQKARGIDTSKRIRLDTETLGKVEGVEN